MFALGAVQVHGAMIAEVIPVRGEECMQPICLSIVGGLVVALASIAGAAAGGIAIPKQTAGVPSMVQPVHALYEAEATLHRHGYHDVRIERATLPYSFNACKRDTRYHIHVNYYGDLVQVDPIGPCHGNGYGYRSEPDGDRYYRRDRHWD
jgi:hypothetical protein